MDDKQRSEAEAREVGRRVREELARRRMSRQALADRARISLSTLEKALAGTRPFTLATTLRIEEVLGLALRPDMPAPRAGDTAPAAMGAYARSAVAWLEGDYLTLRPSFSRPGAIHAYRTTIRWRDDRGHLAFAEAQRSDARFEQAGFVSMPNLSGHIHLVTNEQGQYRLITLSRPTIDGLLYGMIATLQAGPGAQLVPVAAPIVLWKADAEETAFGLIAPGSARHRDYAARLAAATGEDFVRFHPRPV